MKLKQLLKFHQKPSVKHALKKNIGDAYLLAHNPVYFAVRKAVLRAGFKFSADRFYHYDVLPLTELPRILAKKIIPYQDNVSPLAEIEKKAVGIFDLSVVSSLKHNYLMHESAHGVARFITSRTLKTSKSARSTTKILRGINAERETLLRTQLEESFANTTECMANLYVLDEAHDLFFERNAYIFKSRESQKLLLQSVKLHGFEITTRLIFFSYLYSNMIKTEAAVDQFDRVLALVFRTDPDSLQALGEPGREFLLGIFKLGLGLDQQFTVFTNTLCLRLMGLKSDLFDLIAFDFLKWIESEPKYLACIDEFVKTLES